MKSKDWKVQWQNQHCRDACGDQTGKRCGKNCETWSTAKKTEEGAAVFNGKILSESGGTHYDVVVCHSGAEIVSVLCPVENKTKERLARYRSARLSEREIEVQCLKDNGLSRKEICEKLFISLSTLKTHLNRIRHKLGD